MNTGLSKGNCGGKRSTTYMPTAMSERILSTIPPKGISIEQVANILSEKYAVKPDRMFLFVRCTKAAFYNLVKKGKIIAHGAKYSRSIIYKIK